ncbi:hypothetical protein GGI18_002100 [Coemansia linderi]|uniref:Uncharacterized protein n=1 Tax=Coemansia linderi TaxID=2663919 RepID=A0ACC1KI95_9FUNG|nr:hypothetical protein GGI18_002100 [Coemansia linderi]
MPSPKPRSAKGALAIVTGASRGIGRAIALEFLQQGVSVLGVSRTISDPLEGTSAEFIPCIADVTNTDDQKRITEAAKNSGLPLIALVNNAGTLDPLAKLSDIDLSDWRHHFEVNVVAVLALTQLALPMLRATNGRVINISSGAASSAYQGWAAYCASKAALNMVTKSMAVEEPEVVAIAVRPGVVDTDMQKVIRSVGQSAMRDDQFAKFQSLYDDGQLLKPEVPARVIVRLAMEAPRSMSGMFVSWDSPEIDQYIK